MYIKMLCTCTCTCTCTINTLQIVNDGVCPIYITYMYWQDLNYNFQKSRVRQT